jgi:hypothetical protein
VLAVLAVRALGPALVHRVVVRAGVVWCGVAVRCGKRRRREVWNRLLTRVRWTGSGSRRGKGEG